jgi:hypothetical protein
MRAPFGPGDNAMSDEQQASAGNYREIAEKIRQLARQTRIAQVQEELSDLADELDRMAKLADSGGFRRTRKRTSRKT